MTQKSKDFLKMARVIMINKPKDEGDFTCELELNDLKFCSINMSNVSLVVNQDSLPKAVDLVGQTLTKFHKCYEYIEQYIKKYGHNEKSKPSSLEQLNNLRDLLDVLSHPKNPF